MSGAAGDDPEAGGVTMMHFSFSDTIAGYVTDFDQGSDTFGIRTTHGRVFRCKLKGNTYAYLVRNLGDPYSDCTGDLRKMLVRDSYLFVYGIFYPQGDGHVFEAQFLVYVGRKPSEYVFERPDWWIKQISTTATTARRLR